MGELTFADYATANFKDAHTTVSFGGMALQQPLHNFSSTLDKEAAIAVSLAILRYTEEVEDLKKPYITKSIFRELISGLKQGSVDGQFSPYSLIQCWKTTDLDNVQFICGLGILGFQLRDEIYCQIYKHINRKKSENVQQMGWSLFACCLSTFLPSDKLMPYMNNMLNAAPEKERHYCKEKLRRTLMNGNRSEPPSFSEHQAVVRRAFMSYTVYFTNGQSCKLAVDSATTGLELKKQVKTVKQIVDLFGFSFRISNGTKISRVVSGDDHVLDIISSCEQMARAFGLPDACELTFFKEIFSPWHSSSTDKVSTELIYNQVISSIKSGVFRVKKNSNLGQVIAVHAYLLYGANASQQQIREVINSFQLHDTANSNSSPTKRQWMQLIESRFDKMFRRKRETDRTNAAGEVVNFAKLNLDKYFCRMYQAGSTEATGKTFTLTISCCDVRLYPEKPSSQAWKVTFPEIKKVSFQKFKNQRMGIVSITTIYKEEMKFKAPKAERIHELLNFFLNGLRKRSRYLLALSDLQSSGTSDGQLHFSSGDIIILNERCSSETLEVTGHAYGTCQRTGLSGQLSRGLFYTVPTVEAPKPVVLNALKAAELRSERRIKEPVKTKAKVDLLEVTLPRTESYVQWNRELLKQLNIRHNEVRENEVRSTTQAIVHEPPSGLMFEPGHVWDNMPSDDHADEIKPVWTENVSGFNDVTEPPDLQLEKASNTGICESSDDVENDRKDLSDKQDYFDNEDLAQMNSSTFSHLVTNQTFTSETKELHGKDETDVTMKPVRSSDETEDHVSLQKSNSSQDENNGHVNLVNIKNEPKNSFVVDIAWDSERYGCSSFEESDSYKAIMTYISQPAQDIMSEMKLTDSIFGRPLKNSVSEDHVYREIKKHIEAEEDVASVERCWELMWLITGLYSCSDNIKDEVIAFLRPRTDTNQIAKQCYMRLVKMITHGRRTYPPHIAEVQAVQTRMDLISHKVFFPDGSCQSFEVESSTTARDLVSVITESIGLKYPTGCGLFFKIGDKVFGAAEEYFFFDFIQHFIEVYRKVDGGDGIAVNYQVFFLRKVWINVIPGEDRVADCRLHYYQELSKYLRGYYRCTVSESILLASLILRAEFGEDTDNLSEIPDMLNKLVPQEIITLKSVDEWQQVFEKALAENVTSFGDDAKVEFLKRLSKHATFGTAFFHVKINDADELAKREILMAIQKDGLALYAGSDKKLVEKYDFKEVQRWASGDKKITIDVKKGNERKKLEFETSLDYQIDDFLTSYISAYGSVNQEESIVSDDE